MTSVADKNKPVARGSVTLTPVSATSDAPSADQVRVMDLGSLSAADSSANLNVRRRSHAHNSTASYVTAWQSQQMVDQLSKKILSSVGSSAASSPRPAATTKDSRVRGVTQPAHVDANATSDAPVVSSTSSPPPSLRHFHQRASSSATQLPGFSRISPMALKVASTTEKDAVTRVAMSAFQRWRRFPLVRSVRQQSQVAVHPHATQPVHTATMSGGEWPTMKESTVSSLFTSAGARSMLPVRAPDSAAPRLPVWKEPTSEPSDASPLAVGEQKPPAKVGRAAVDKVLATSTSMSGNATSAASGLTQRRVTPRGAVLLNSNSDYSELTEEHPHSLSLAALSHNASGEPTPPDASPHGNADSSLVSPSQPIISLMNVHSRRPTPLRPYATASQASRSCSARSGPSIGVGEDGADDFQRRWEEEGLSASERLEDLTSIEEDHRHSITETEHRRRTRLLARYTRASDAIFMGALKVSTGSRPYPSLTSSAANPSLNVEDTPSDDNVSFWAAVSLGVGYGHGMGNASGSSLPGCVNASSSEGGFSGRSAAGAGAAAAGAGVGIPASNVMSVPHIVSQRAAQAPLPLAPTPGHSPRHTASTATPRRAAEKLAEKSTAIGAVTGSGRQQQQQQQQQPVHIVVEKKHVTGTTGPLEDSLPCELCPILPTTSPGPGLHAPSCSEANQIGSEDGLEDVTLSAVTVSCTNSLNSTRNNAASVSMVAGTADTAQPGTDAPPLRKTPPPPWTQSAPTHDASSQSRQASDTLRRAIDDVTHPPREPTPGVSSQLDEDESVSSSTLRAAVTTKQPPRSLQPSSTSRRVRPFVDKPQSDARQALEEAVNLGAANTSLASPDAVAARAIVRGAKAVDAQQRCFLRVDPTPVPLTPEVLHTSAAPAVTASPAGELSQSPATTPPATSVVARRRRSSGLTLGHTEADPGMASQATSPAMSRRVSSTAAVTLTPNGTELTGGGVAALNRETYHSLIRGQEKEARNAITIEYRSGLVDILKECHFMK